MSEFAGFLQVIDEALVLGGAVVLRGDTEEIGRVHGDVAVVLRKLMRAAIAADRDGAASEASGSLRKQQSPPLSSR